MVQNNPFNVFRGPDSVMQYYNPDLQPPLPLVEIPDRLNPFRGDGVRIYAKMMNMFPAHNIKAMPVLNMLLDEDISPNAETLVEQSSGSTVVSMSIIARLLHGIEDVRAYTTNKTSLSRMKTLRFFGLQVVLYGGSQQPEPQDPRGGIGKAQKLSEQNERVIHLNQYKNSRNPNSHVRWTGPQILKQLPEINVLCLPMGTGGVVTGIGSFFKKAKPEITVIGVCNANGDPIPGPRPFSLFQSVDFPWRDAVDTVDEISSRDSYYLSMQLSREGLISGPSSGMGLKALHNFLQKHRDEGTLSSLAGPDGTVSCVFMCCDFPYQYLDDYFAKLGEDHFRPIVNKNLIDVDTHLYDNAWEIEPSAALKILFSKPETAIFAKGPVVNGKAAVNGNTTTRKSGTTNGISNGSSNLTSPATDESSSEFPSPQIEPNAVLLDLRSPNDFATNHLPGALNLPLFSLRASDGSPFEDSILLENQWRELEALFDDGEPGKEFWREFESKDVVLMCHGGDTAKVASSVLRARGIKAVSIKGGIRGMQS